MIGGLVAAIVSGLFALLVGAVAKRRIETGMIVPSSRPGMGSGRTTREWHPIWFWFWNVQLIGATLMLSVVAVLCLADALGIAQIVTTNESQNAPNR